MVCFVICNYSTGSYLIIEHFQHIVSEYWFVTWNIIWTDLNFHDGTYYELECRNVLCFFYYYMDMSWNFIWILMDSQNLKMVQKLISNMWIISGCYIVIFCCISVSVYGTTVLLEGEWCKVLQMDTCIYHCYDNIFYGVKVNIWGRIGWEIIYNIYKIKRKT